jgi:DNA-binding NarL/FixJ family response regulator
MYSSENPKDLARHHVGRVDRIGPVVPDRLRTNDRRSIVIVSPPGAIPDCIVEAVKREFPCFQIEHVPDIEDIGVDFGHPVGLFLVDSAFLPRLDDQIKRHRDLHRQAVSAVIFDNLDSARADFLLICRSDFVRGVLPMNLKLDVWLSAVGLLMRGGEYAPTSLLRNCRQNGQLVALNELTGRELEILALVAQGPQNKVIASELGLSEHTVKIHIHNIIRKLGVHNRTEAAAVFLQPSMSGDRNGGDNV